MVRCHFSTDFSYVRDHTYTVTHLEHCNEDNRLLQINFSLYNHTMNIFEDSMNMLT